MTTCESCQLFGAYEALAGIRGSVVLLHSVTGCNFGTLTLDLLQHMNEINQCCTVISDTDVIMGGENSVEAALHSVWELYHPQAVFVISGCIANMIGDDINSAIHLADLPCPVLHIPAPGFGGGIRKGYEMAAEALFSIMEAPSDKEHIHKKRVNIIGVGSGDWRVEADKKAIQRILPADVEIGMFFSCCTMEDVKKAAYSSLNLVFGQGIRLAQKMKKAYGIPYIELAYPYGITGEKSIGHALEELIGIPYEENKEQKKNIQSLKKMYTYLQALYGSSAAIIGSKSRALGMKQFLEEELGMDVVCFAIRDEIENLETFYDSLKRTEAALLFGSSFETSMARKLELPLIRFDYPVFDRICITEKPYAGSAGVPYLIEDILNEIFSEKKNEGALYQ